jgi:hypothetical protein
VRIDHFARASAVVVIAEGNSRRQATQCLQTTGITKSQYVSATFARLEAVVNRLELGDPCWPQ